MARGSLLTAADIGHCVHRVALDRGSPAPVPTEALSTEILRRIRESSEHRDRTARRFTELHHDARIAGSPDATVEAMSAGADLILRARLVDDLDGRRTSAVDALVRVGEAAGRARYSPIIIKYNEVVENASTRRLLRGDIASPHPDEAQWIGGVGTRRNDTMTRNGLTLAHALRALGAHGHEDPQHRGAVVDRHDQMWWFDLDNEDWPRWRLAAYDTAYRERVEILRDHEAFVRGEGPFPTSPYWHRECPTCPYAARCEAELEADDDVSLVRFTSLEQQVLMREYGISTRRHLATLDPSLARSSRGKVPTPNVEMTVEEHLGRVIDKLDELIYRARSTAAGTPLRIVAPELIGCPIADVEVDIDMESYDERTYLWGAHVSCNRPVNGITEGYVSFVCWRQVDDAAEARVFSEFWHWFSGIQRAAREAGATFAAYCFWAHAEDAAMNRAVLFGGDGVPSAGELDAFRRGVPSEWIDLHAVAKGQIQTDGPLGLKVLAKAAGFEWRDANPSGEASMTWFEEATSTDEAAAQAARQRLLEYNEDDCRATKALRDWINSGARILPSRDQRP